MQSRSKGLLLALLVIVLSIVGSAAGSTIARTFVLRPGDTVHFNERGVWGCHRLMVGGVRCYGAASHMPFVKFVRAYGPVVVQADTRPKVVRINHAKGPFGPWTEWVYTF
jgi:hypothetical protein